MVATCALITRDTSAPRPRAVEAGATDPDQDLEVGVVLARVRGVAAEAAAGKFSTGFVAKKVFYCLFQPLKITLSITISPIKIPIKPTFTISFQRSPLSFPL